MIFFKKIINFLSSLKVAIVLILLIATSSAIGTAIPQNQPKEDYISIFQSKPWLGFIDGDTILRLSLDQVYSSLWFLGLLLWLGISLILCSFRRQLPTLKSAMRWIDYKNPIELSKLAIVQSKVFNNSQTKLAEIAESLESKGWDVKLKHNRLAARKGIIGRAGPPIVHLGLIVLMIGSTWGATTGQKVEKFLAPNRSFELISPNGISQFNLSLADFKIKRDPEGRPEQFISTIKIHIPGENIETVKEISVNHPLRFHGITIYQADWSLAAITLQIANSPKLQIPVRDLPELGEQIWGVVVPTKKDNTNPLLFTVSSEQGPIRVFDENGNDLASLRPGGEAKEVKGISIRALDVLPASGLLIKKDPGVPIVYIGFTITLIGSVLSILATRQIWAISETDKKCLHIGGLCNRDLSGLAKEIPSLIN